MCFSPLSSTSTSFPFFSSSSSFLSLVFQRMVLMAFPRVGEDCFRQLPLRSSRQVHQEQGSPFRRGAPWIRRDHSRRNQIKANFGRCPFFDGYTLFSCFSFSFPSFFFSLFFKSKKVQLFLLSLFLFVYLFIYYYYFWKKRN